MRLRIVLLALLLLPGGAAFAQLTIEIVEGRDEAAKIIRDAGGTTASRVSKKTDYLVAGEKAGSKFTKAKQLGTTILTEAELQELCEADPD